MKKFDYIMISGHGRSGTNWLLEVLDLSGHTYCRNEPNELCDSPLSKLGSEWVREIDEAEFGEMWDQAMATTAISIGSRDQRISRDKDFLRTFPRLVGLYRIARNYRLRKSINKIAPTARCHEWLASPLVFNHSQMRQALTVIKINQAPGWASWLLENRKRAGVLHIVRHPAGMLNSWRKRYLEKNVREKVEAENRHRLNKIARLAPDWGTRFGNIDAMSVEESELWFWRYSVESVHLAGQSNEGYHLVLFDDLASNPDKGARGVYQFCGLNYTREISDQVKRSSEHSQSIADSWKKAMSDQDKRKIAKVCRGSLMSEWWPDVA